MRSSLQIRRTHVLLAAAAFAAVATLVAVHAASGASTTANLKVESTALGKILADPRGHSLYMFAADKGKTSVCYGTCAAFWPPLLSKSAHPVGTGLKASLLGTTKRKGGTLQITYAGHPLYLFVKDTKAGQTNGQGLNEVGGLWWVLSPSGAVIHKKAGAAPAKSSGGTTTTTPGYGYGNGY
jgi:predicted lipoprotein with Yx(FWY)xxD motif